MTSKRNSNIRALLRTPRGRLFLLFAAWFLVFEVLIVTGTAITVWMLSQDLPKFKDLENKTYDQALSTIVYSADGVELRTFKERERFWVEYDNVPQCMIDAVLAAEDSRFFQHWGGSLPDIARAMVANLAAIRPTLSTKFPFVLDLSIGQGGSTITQQLARDLFLNREKTVARKIRELLVAVQLERMYSKSEIMEFFLNRMFFGNNSYGIQAAARGYFGKDVSELDVGEAALLAGILQAPTDYNPRSTDHPREVQLTIAKRRRDTVLQMMLNNGSMTRAQSDEARTKPVVLSEISGLEYGKAPYFVDYVADILRRQYGEEYLKTSGARVYTSLDYRLQEIAERALRAQLDSIQTRYSRVTYRRPAGMSNENAVQDSLRKTQVQGALLAMDLETGRILAMVGGRQYSDQNMFNRAVQAIRQSGSAFKPFVYTAALDNGWRACDTIYDSYVSYELPNGDVWEPQNFEGDYLGLMSLRDGFNKSQNIIAVKLMNDREHRGIGPENVVKYAQMMGITTPIPPFYSIAVGTAEVRLIEMVAAYAIFPNLGIRTEPIAITEIHDKDDNLLARTAEGNKRYVLKPQLASLMVTMFRSAALEGTASGPTARQIMDGRPYGGKTGTAQENKDTWFIGFTPHIVCGVWIGFDDENTTLRQPFHTGAAATLPVWCIFMSEASEVLGLPKDDFTLSPTGLTMGMVCRDSYKRATPYCPPENTYREYFIEGTELTEDCDIHAPSRPRTRPILPKGSPRGR